MQYTDFHNIDFKSHDLGFYLVKVSPEIAKEILTMSQGNRKAKKSHIKMLASDMAAGNWRLNGECFRFDWNGAFRDGHHRCFAIISSNTTQDILMQTGLDPSQCDIYDKGVTRSTQDIFKMKGESAWQSSTLIIAVVRMHYRLQFEDSKPSDTSILEFELRNASALTLVNRIANKGTGRLATRNAAVLTAIFYAVALNFSQQKIERFADVVSGSLPEGPEESSAFVLMKQYTNKEFGVDTYGRKHLLFATERAICDFCASKPRKQRYTGSTPAYSDNILLQNL